MTEQLIIIMTSYPNKTTSLKHLIIGSLKQKLAVCVQQVNYVKSYYLWEGKIKKDHEKIVLFKTTAERQQKLISYIKKLHPYDIPEIIVLSPDEVDETYLQRAQSAKKMK